MDIFSFNEAFATEVKEVDINFQFKLFDCAVLATSYSRVSEKNHATFKVARKINSKLVTSNLII